MEDIGVVWNSKGVEKFKLVKRFDTFDILEMSEEKSDKNVIIDYN